MASQIAEVQLPDGRIVELEVPKGTSEQQIIDFVSQQDFSRGGPSVEQGPPKWKRDVSDAAHTVLPAVGGTVGSLIGGGAGATGGTIAAPGPGTIAGAALGAPVGGALGYGIGKQGARLVDQGLGLDPAQPMGEEARRAVGNVMEGITGEGLGLMTGGILSGAAPVARAFGEGVRAVGRTVAPLSKKGAERVVRELLQKYQRTQDPQFLAEAQRLQQQIPGFRTTYGLATNNPDLVSFERSVAVSGKPGLETVKGQTQDLLQGNVTAARGHLQRVAPGNVDDFTGELTRQRVGMEATRQRLSAVDPQQTGQNVLDIVETAKEPVKAAMGRLGEAIPDYPMQFSRTGQALKKLKDIKNLSPNQRQAVEAAERMIAEVQGKAGQSTMTAQGISRGLDEMISAAQGAPGREKAVPLLMQIKQAIGDDLAEVSQLASTGKMAIHKGKAVYPGQLAQELQDNLTELATLQSQIKPDYDAATAILEQHNPLVRYGKQPGMTDKGLQQWIERDWKHLNPKTPMPTVTGGNTQRLAALQQRNQEISDILQNVDPAQDVAAALGAYNKYASENYFGRFETPTMQNVKRTQRTENIGRQLATPSGVDDLVKAVGKPEARRIMQEHYHAEFAGLLDKNPNDVRLNQWLRSNAKTLGKAGLYDDFAKLVKEQQGRHLVEKIAGADLPSVFSSIMGKSSKAQAETLKPIIARVRHNPKALAGLKRSFVDYLDQTVFKEVKMDEAGVRGLYQTLRQLEPTIDLLFNAQEKQVLSEVRKAIGITQRLTYSSPLGGSQTAELLKAGKRVVEGEKPSRTVTGVMSLIAGLSLKGLGASGTIIGTGVAYNGLNQWRTMIKETGNKRVREYFVRAMFDPQYARTLVESTRYATVPTHVQKQIRNQLGQLAGRSSFAALQASGRAE